jgi:hypothetical protein
MTKITTSVEEYFWTHLAITNYFRVKYKVLNSLEREKQRKTQRISTNSQRLS